MKRRIVIIYWAVAVVFFPKAAFAYIDPATTTYLIQIATAVIVMAGVSLTVFLYRFRTISAKMKYWLYGILYRTGLVRSVKQEKTKRESTNTSTDNCGDDPYTMPVYILPGSQTSPDILSFDSDNRDELMKSKAQYTTKEADIINTPQTYQSRVRMVIPLVVAFCYTFIVIGCLELLVRHSPEIPFKIISIVPTVILLFAALFVFLVLVIPCFRGRIYELIISLGASILFAGYLQGNFLNTGLGQLTGDALVLSNLKPQIALSLICWIACLIVVFLLLWRSKKVWRGLLFYAPILLIVVQSASFISTISKDMNNNEWGAGTFWATADECLTINEINDVASDKNAIIIILDRLDNDLVKEIDLENPDFFDPLDGFTRFDDFITHYGTTFPSVSNILTGHLYMYDMPREQFFDDSWENADFLSALKERGFDIRLYMDKGFSFSRIDQLHGLASNIVSNEISINKRVTLVKLLKLSGYRFGPMLLKNFFWVSPTEFIDTLIMTDENAPYITNDIAYYENLTSNGLNISDSQNSFIFLHLLGPHPPHFMDENIQYVEESTPKKQGMGAFKIVFEYLEQLKELGLYDDATIVIMGDHGFYDKLELTRTIHTGLFVKPSGSFGTPIEISNAPVSPNQLHATIMKSLFGDTEGFGDTFFDINEGDDVIRSYTTARYRFDIHGDGHDFANWNLIGQFPSTFEK